MFNRITIPTGKIFAVLYLSKPELRPYTMADVTTKPQGFVNKMSLYNDELYLNFYWPYVFINKSYVTRTKSLVFVCWISG